jgi:hypothetical protein
MKPGLKPGRGSLFFFSGVVETFCEAVGKSRRRSEAVPVVILIVTA